MVSAYTTAQNAAIAPVAGKALAVGPKAKPGVLQGRAGSRTICVMHRFFIAKEDIADGQVRLSKEHAHQIRDVLRMCVGRQIVVLDNNGSEYDVTLTTVDRQSVVGCITETRQATGEPTIQLAMFQAMLSRDKFEWVLQKCTEVGVTHFVPVVTQRTLVRKTAVKADKLIRWQRIITEAAEQSGRGRIPVIYEPVMFEQVITKRNQISNTKTCPERSRRNQKCGDTDLQSPEVEFDCRLIAVPSCDARNLHQALTTGGKKPTRIALFIGPEGGFAEDEVRVARDDGVVPVSLGPRTLRTETAAVVASTLILYELGQMSA